jgi:hypothetical protein
MPERKPTSPQAQADRIMEKYDPIAIPCTHRHVKDRLRTRGFVRIKSLGYGTNTWLLWPTETCTRPTAVARRVGTKLLVWGPFPRTPEPRDTGAELGRTHSLKVRGAVLDAALEALGVTRRKREGYGAALRRWYEQEKLK